MKYFSIYNIKERFILNTLKWLEIHFVNSGQLLHAERLVKKYFRILRTRGKKSAIQFCKERRSAILLWLTTIDSLEPEVRTSSKMVLPRDLRFLKRIKQYDTLFIRLILSSLYVSRGLRLPVTPNYESITSEPTYSSINKFYKHIPGFWKTLGYRSRKNVPKRVQWTKYHFTTKSGPNGQALWSSIADLKAMPLDMLTHFEQVGGKKLFSKMSLLKKHIDILYPFFNKQGQHLRKVVCIPDVEGKTREVAILDYWSQTALRGLHQWLFKALKRIPQDCTFNQGEFKNKLDLTRTGESFHSVDLTTATDRFPIELISEVLKFPLGKDYVSSWRYLMVGIPFYYPAGKLDITYAVGNPMGAYSSWNSFALTHHYVVYYCCRELGIQWSEASYVLLGDDIVIKDDKLAKKYMEVMTELGLCFSLQKSHISPHCFEFAKRFFFNGSEVTPFPVDALLSTRRSPSLMFNVINDEVSKGWDSPLGTPAVASELYRILGFNSTYVKKKLEIFYISHQIMMGIRGCVTAGSACKAIMEYICPDKFSRIFSKLPPDFIEAVGQYWFIDMFNKSLVSSVADSKVGGKPLGLIAEELVILLTGQEETALDAFELIPSVPVCHIHGQVEEIWLSVVKGGGSRILSGLKHDWKAMIRTLTIPISDEIYVSRNHEVLVKSSFIFGKSLRKTIEEFKGLQDLKSMSRPKF